jgi:hypothetical protein
MLANNREQRQLLHVQTMQELADFMEELRSQVQTYLATTQAERQARAIELRHKLTQSRAALATDVETLFERLATFRAELRQTRSNLHNRVWGQAVPIATAPTKVTTKPAVTKPTTKVLPKPIATKPIKLPAIAPTTTKPKANPTQPLAATLPLVETSQNEASLTVVPIPAKDGLAYEKEVYNHIHTVNGARLTEIESSLDINRFQAVDALRSLIKKGLITQRDRVYLTQEPAQV